METLRTVLVQGTLTSATLALVALGFSLVFGVGGIVNLAHGSFYLVGAYAAVVLHDAGLPLLLAALGAVAIATVAGLLLDLLVIRRVEDRGVSVLIATLAVALFVEAAARYSFGAKDRNLDSFASGGTTLLGVDVLTSRVVAFAVATAAVAAVLCVLRFTAAGRVVRAVSEDAEAARLMGIDTGRVTLAVVGVGAGLAGLAAVVVSPFQVVEPTMWLPPLTSAFAIVILGGLGSVNGTVLAAVLVGFLDRFVAEVVPEGEVKVGLVTIVVILATLVLRPQGLRGKPAAGH